MDRPARLTFQAPAKVNLCLKVRGRRADGYHELDTIMARLKLADTLTLSIDEAGAEGQAVRSQAACLPQPLPPDFDGPPNLVWRAVNIFREAAGWPKGWVELRVEKRVPLGGGLGGGSSDAAAVLAALNRLAPRPLGEEGLGRLAATLGADVPFFLGERKVARARGIGEILLEPPPEYGRWAGRPLILVNPGPAVSTAEVFKTLGLTNPPPDNNLGPVSLPNPGQNDLLPPAMKISAEIREAAQALEGLKVPWGLSGSGATFWVAGEAETAEKLTKAHLGWWIRATAIAD